MRTMNITLRSTFIRDATCNKTINEKRTEKDNAIKQHVKLLYNNIPIVFHVKDIRSLASVLNLFV